MNFLGVDLLTDQAQVLDGQKLEGLACTVATTGTSARRLHLLLSTRSESDPDPTQHVHVLNLAPAVLADLLVALAPVVSDEERKAAEARYYQGLRSEPEPRPTAPADDDMPF